MTNRGGHGRWTSTWRLWELAELVAQVCAALDPDDPLTVSARRFDRERAALGWLDVPSSASIRERMGRPAWTKLVATCVAPNRLGARYRNLNRWLDPWQRDQFSPGEIAEALRLIARRLDRTTLRQGEYSEERHCLLREAASRRTARTPALPTMTQARYFAGGDWGDALRLARMTATPAREKADLMRGLSSVDALDLCVEVFGVLATSPETERFARANDLRFAYERPMPSLDERLRQLVARRRARGQDTPLKPPPRGERPDYDARVDPQRIPEPYRIPALRGQNRETGLAALSGFLEQLPSGLLPVRELYWEYTLRTPGAPHETVMPKFGGFVALRDEAVTARIASRRGDT